MKLIFSVVLFVVVLAAFVRCSPVESDGQGELVRADRHRRLTCDLLSIEVASFAINDSACAAHCLAMLKGYTGGTCQNGVCHCRE